MRHELRTEIQIDAAPSEVWTRLVDLAAYAGWNPFITSASGKAVVGQRLELRLEPPGGRPTTIRPTVTEAEPGHVLEWLGRLGLPGIFEGRHRFELVAVDGGTTFVHSETFRGLLVRPLRRSLDTSTRRGFEAMNRALAARVAPEPAAV